jgi:hypothetical protein
LRKKVDFLFSIIVLLILVWMVYEARGWAMKARLFPWTIGISGIVLALLQLSFATRNLLRPTPAPAHADVAEQARAEYGPAATAAAEQHDAAAAGEVSVVSAAVESAFGEGSAAAEDEEIPPEVVRRRSFEMVGWILGFAVGILLLGFTMAAGLLSLLFFKTASRERWSTALWISISTYLFFYIVFERALNIPFPAGLIADWLHPPSLNTFVDPLINPLMGRS